MQIGSFDLIYNQLVQDVAKNGVWDKGEEVRTKYADGSPAYTKSVFGRQVIIPPEMVTILTTKQVGYKSSARELYWIWFLKSNIVQILRDMKCYIWDEWEKEDGTIGKAYGYQLAKKVNGEMDQVDNFLFQLETSPASRRHIVTLWDAEDVPEMALTPCVWSTQWKILGGKLHVLVSQRSADLALGVVFNMLQYKLLQKIVLNHLRQFERFHNLELGDLIWNFGDLHFYDRHEGLLLEQIKGDIHDAPKLILDEAMGNSFYEFNPELIRLEDYKHNGKFEYEVAI